MAKSKGRTVEVDFTDASTGGGRLRVPAGDYPFVVKEVKQDTSKANNSMLVVTFTGLEGRVKGKNLKDYFVLTKESLWKLRGFMEALGIDTPSSKTRVNIDEFPKKKVGITLEDDEFDGRISSKPSDYIPYEDLGSEPDDDEDEDEDEDEIDVEEDDDDLDEMDRAALKAELKTRGQSVKKSEDEDDLRVRLRALIAKTEDDDELEDIDLDEEM